MTYEILNAHGELLATFSDADAVYNYLADNFLLTIGKGEYVCSETDQLIKYVNVL